MLTYKKLLPQGIIGRRRLSKLKVKDDDDKSETTSEKSTRGSSVGPAHSDSTIDEDYYPHGLDDIDNIEELPNKRESAIAVKATSSVIPPSRAASIASQAGDGAIPAKESIGGYGIAHEHGMHPNHPQLLVPIESSLSSTSIKSRLTSVTTMTDAVPPSEQHFRTRDIIDESRFLSRKRAPGVSQRDFPLRSQSSGFSRKSTDEDRLSTGGTGGTSGLGYSPLRLSRVFGRNDKIPILNLTGIHQSHIVYSASNVVVLFDYVNNQQRMLQGHKNKITCLAKDPGNIHFASGDVGQNSVIIIWDISSGYPFRTFPVSHGDGDFGVISIAFVGTEEYIGSIGNEMRYSDSDNKSKLVHGHHVNLDTHTPHADDDDSFDDSIIKTKRTVVEEKQNICIWHLSHHEGRLAQREHHHHHEKAGGKPAAVFAIPSFVGHQRDIAFCDEKPEYFVTTGDRCVVFYTWLKHEKIIKHHVPKRSMKFMAKINKFTQTIWMRQTKWCLTGTDVGYVIAWATPVPLGLQTPPDPRLNIKEYKRSYKVGECAVTALISHKDYFIIGDETGVVKFFDIKFRILRWTKSSPQLTLRPITCIACNQSDGLPDFKKEMQEHYDRRRDQRQLVRDWTYGGQKFRQPSQATLERQAFFAPDFIIGCQGGDVHYCHLAEGKADQVIFGTAGEVVAMDTCPSTTHVTTSTKEGFVQMYDYTTNKLIFSGSIFKKFVEVSCMKFHPTGSFAFFGMRNGQLYFRRAYTWKPMEAPLDNCTSCVERIIFSSTGTYMAHYDASHVVTLYIDNPQRNSWVLRGKHRSHYLPIVDLVFFRDDTRNKERLFSLGQDRFIIEYDIYTSVQATGLKVLYRYPIDTQFVPTSMTFDAPWKDHRPILLVANTGNKMRFFDQDIREIKKHVQGPTYGTSVNRMITVKPALDQGRSSQFILMTLGNKLGLMKTPVDGNPFKYMAVLGHSEGIREISIGCNGKEIFTCGINDDCVFQWEPNIAALETCVLSGGSGVAPYLKMLDAGLPPGKSLAEDVENVFYHLLIRRTKDQQEMLSMKLELPIIDIPLVLRTCGTFLTEYQHEMMVEEALELGIIRDGEIPTMITFEDFVQLFANYKEFPPVVEDEVVEAFHVLGEINEQEELFISRDKFIEYICGRGEKIHASQLPSFLPSLYQSKENLVVFEEAGPPAWFDLIDTSQLPQDQQDAIAAANAALAANSSSDDSINNNDENQRDQNNPQGETSTAKPQDENVKKAEGEAETTGGNIPSKHSLKGSTKSDDKLKSKSAATLNSAASTSITTVITKASSKASRGRKNKSQATTCKTTEDLNKDVDYSKLQFGKAYTVEDPNSQYQFTAEDEVEFTNKELPEEITLEYFMEEIIPPDATETMDWISLSLNERKELDDIYAREPDRTTWNDILERWRYRDEWRYFRGTFDLIKGEKAPFIDKLARAVEMDHYCKRGLWPSQAPTEYGGEGEQEGESQQGEQISSSYESGSGSYESTTTSSGDKDGREEDKEKPKEQQKQAKISVRKSKVESTTKISASEHGSNASIVPSQQVEHQHHHHHRKLSKDEHHHQDKKLSKVEPNEQTKSTTEVSLKQIKSESFKDATNRKSSGKLGRTLSAIEPDIRMPSYTAVEEESSLIKGIVSNHSSELGVSQQVQPDLEHQQLTTQDTLDEVSPEIFDTMEDEEEEAEETT